MITNIVRWLAGKKTYLVAIAGVTYALGIKYWHWPNDTEIWAGLGFTGVATLRAAISKLCAQVAENTINPNSPLMRLLLCAAILGSSVTLQGCANSPGPNATAQQKAQAAIDTATNGAKYIVGPAVTAFILLQKDPAKRAQDAAYVYAGATALNSAATGAVPTQTDLQALIATFVKPDPRYADLAQLLASEYGTLYPLFKVAGTSPVKFLTEVAIQAQNAAKPFLAPAPSA